MHSLYQIFLYISSFISVFLGLFIYKNKKSEISTAFLMLCIFVFIWLFSFARISIAYNLTTSFIFAKIGFCAMAFIPVSAMFFMFSFVKVKIKKSVYILLSVINILLILFTFYSDLIFEYMNATPWGIYPAAGSLHPVFVIYSVIMFMIPLVYLYRYIHRSEISSIQKQKAIQIILVYSVSMILFVFENLFFYEVFMFEPITYLTVLFYVIFTAMIISKYSIANIRVLSIKIFLFVCMLIFMLVITKYILTFSTNIYVSNFITFMLTIGCFSVYQKIMTEAENILLSKNKHYQDILINAASGMAKEHNINRLLKLISIIVLKTIKVEAVAIFLENKEKKNYEIKMIRTFNTRANELMFSYDYKHPFIVYSSAKKEPFLFDEIPQYIALSVVLPFRPALVVPSFLEGVKGFMVIGEKNNKDIFSKDDIAVFKMLARQTSLVMENCLFFDEYKQAQEKIFTAEKLASIGGLAEGVAHQVRNRLNEFSMISGELKCEIKELTEKNKDMADSNSETFKYLNHLADSLKFNIGKTNDIVRGILDYAKTEAQHTMFELFELKEVIDLSFDLLRVKHRTQISDKVAVSVNLAAGSKIAGVKSQMTEVIYNLLDNAFEATEEKRMKLYKENLTGYIPKIEISMTKKEKTDVIKISDNGIGIKESLMPKIFIPFFTTKSSAKSGTGIGMYIVKRMITENHKGKISIESEYSEGTVITIELPNELPK